METLSVKRVGIHLGAVLASMTLAAYSFLRAFLIEPFTGMTLVGVAMAATGWSAWRAFSSISVPYRLASCVASVVVALWVSNVIGNRWAVSAVRAEAPLVLRELNRRSVDVPSTFDIPGASYLRRVHLNSGPGGDGIRATFGLPSGMVIQYVSSRRSWKSAAARPCTSEIAPGWYWHSRCK
jgi:hypothetical protein